MSIRMIALLFVLLFTFPSGASAQNSETLRNDARQNKLSFGVRPGDFDRTQDPVSPPARLIEPLDVRYPDAAVRKRLEGTAIISAAVDERGDVTYGELRTSSGHPSLDSAALAAVQDGLFKPAQRHGKTVSSRISVPVEFRLSGDIDKYDSPKSMEELEADKQDLEKIKEMLRKEQQQLEEEIERLKQQNSQSTPEKKQK